MDKIYNWSFYVTQHEETTVMACYVEDEAWEIYYKRPGFPFMNAFGLPTTEPIDNVFRIAIANISEYDDMFE